MIKDRKLTEKARSLPRMYVSPSEQLLIFPWSTNMNANTTISGENENFVLLTALGHRYRHGRGSLLGTLQ